MVYHHNTFASIVLFSSTLMAVGAEHATRRIVLVEEFTNLGCAPCAQAAPVVDSLLVDRLGEVAAIKYHVNWPFGADPFYVADAQDINARIASYNVGSVPAVMIDGTQASANAHSMDYFIDAGLQKERRIDFGISSALSADNELSVSLHLDAREAVSGHDLHLYLCVTEEYAKMDKMNPNGEKECIYSCRKMLPDGQGAALGDAIAAGWSGDYEYTWSVDNFYNVANLGLVAFVQDAVTHEVIDAVYAPRNAGVPDAATILRVSETPDRICSPHYSAKLKIRNTGSNPMEEAQLNMEVNGQLQQTLWNGHLEYLESEEVWLPDFAGFTLDESGTNVARFWISDVNGLPGTESGVQEVSFASSKIAEYSVQLTFYTDKRPEESSWTLYDADGHIVAVSEPYTQPRHKYVEMLPIHEDGCYMIDFADAGGNGIVGDYGNGYYQLSQVDASGSRKMLLQGDYDNAGVSVHFGLKEAAPSAIEMVHPEASASHGVVKIFDDRSKQIIIYNHNNEKAYYLNAADCPARAGHGAMEQ